MQYTPEEFKSDLDDYSKLIVYRHPMDRLRSAYENKIRLNEAVFQNCVDELVQKYKLSDKQQMKFWMFAETLLDRNSVIYNHHHANHWKPVWAVCSPCHYDYNIYAKLESLEHDLQVSILRKMNRSVEHLRNMTRHVMSSNNIHSLPYVSPKTLEYFEELSDDVRAGLWEMFELDFMLGGYTMNWERLETGCRITSSSGVCC